MASQQNDSATIAITVNGQPREVSSGVTVADLLEAMGIAGERVADLAAKSSFEGVTAQFFVGGDAPDVG